jgi:hypothetical protein
LGRLHEAIKQANAREQLAGDLGLDLPTHTQTLKRHRWTEPAVKTALDGLLKGRDRWPTKREFCEAGLDGLHNALWRTGRRDAWAHRYGIRIVGRGRRGAM